MKNMILSVLILSFSITFSNCDLNRSARETNPYPTSVQQSPVFIKQDVNDNSNQNKTTNDENAFECVRSEPAPIIKKSVFPNTIFRLKKNKEYPFQNLGYETVTFTNGDKLLIENIGCENYTLIFHIQTSRFLGKEDDARFWYKTAAQIMAQVNKGISDPYITKIGLKALNTYIKKNKKLKFDMEIDFGGSVIRSVVTLNEIKKIKNNRVEIVLSFGTGPL